MTLAHFNLTVEDAIMLHLLDYSKFQDEFEAPYYITQHGIADTIGIRRSHVSNVIKGLKQKDYVNEKIAHVKDSARKRKVYFLTLTGGDYSLKLRDNIGQRTINLIVEQGQTRTIKLSDIKNHVQTQLSLLQLLLLVTSDGSLDQKSIQQHEIELDKSKTKVVDGHKPVNFIDNMAEPIRFVGREFEQKQIKTWIDEELPRLIVVKGIAGIGKTTLAAKIIGDYAQESNMNVFWYRFQEWDTIRGTLRDLSEFLLQLGRKKLHFYIENEPNIELPEIMKVLEADLRNLHVIMVFDDLQKISEDLLRLFQIFIELLEIERLKNANIMILTRGSTSFYDRRKVAIKNLVAELELGGLDSLACKQLLNLEKMEDSKFEKICKVTEGHPLALELINIHMSSKAGDDSSELDLSDFFKSDRDLNKYLREEIFLDLSTTERKLLEMISLFRYPVSQEAFFIDDDIDYEYIDKLFERSLIHETPSGFDVHELIREFFLRRMSPKHKTKYHKLAARYYTSMLEDDVFLEDSDYDLRGMAIIEAQYHNICAGDYENTAYLMIEHGEELIRKGYTDEMTAMLNGLNPEKVSEEAWAELLIRKGQILTLRGKWDDAFNCYSDSLRIYETQDNKKGLANAYNSIGAIHYRKGEWKKAMDNYSKGLDFAEKQGDTQNRSKLYSNIALVHWSKGELARAKELLRKSLKLSEKLGDTQGIARAYNNLGIIHWEQRELDEAITAYEKSLKLSSDFEDKRTTAILYGNIGEVYRIKGSDEKARDYYQKSLDLSDELGFIWQTAEIYCNLGEMHKNSNKGESKEYLTKALEIYNTLGAKKQIEKVQDFINKI